MQFNIETERLSIEKMSQEDLHDLVDRTVFSGERPTEPWQVDLEAMGILFRGTCQVRQLTEDTIIKWSSNEVENGAFMMAHVAKHTSIPVPRVRRHWYDHVKEITFTVMDYIPQSDILERVWPQLSPEEQFWVAQTVRNYLEQLRAVPPPPGWSGAPGPFTESNEPLACEVPSVFGDYGAGPFDTYADMTAWFDNKRTTLLLFQYKGTKLRPGDGVIREVAMFDNTAPLVMSHGDLHMRNILLQRNPSSGRYDKVWLVDWDRSGFYPPAVEGYAMLQSPACAPSWRAYIPFIAGSYDRDYEFFDVLQHPYLNLDRKTPDTDSVEDEEARAKIIGIRPSV